MYRTGDLKIKGSTDDWHPVTTDSREDYADDVPDGTVYLPHSCDEWVIGGEKEATALIKDLMVLFNIDNVVVDKSAEMNKWFASLVREDRLDDSTVFCDGCSQAYGWAEADGLLVAWKEKHFQHRKK